MGLEVRHNLELTTFWIILQRWTDYRTIFV